MGINDGVSGPMAEQVRKRKTLERAPAVEVPPHNMRDHLDFDQREFAAGDAVAYRADSTFGRGAGGGGGEYVIAALLPGTHVGGPLYPDNTLTSVPLEIVANAGPFAATASGYQIEYQGPDRWAEVEAAFKFAHVANGRRLLEVKFGTIAFAEDRRYPETNPPFASPDTPTLRVAFAVKLYTSGYVSAAVYQNSGAALGIAWDILPREEQAMNEQFLKVSLL